MIQQKKLNTNPARQRLIPCHPCKDPDEPQSYDAVVALSVIGYEDVSSGQWILLYV